jgi:hypothetical protein
MPKPNLAPLPQDQAPGAVPEAENEAWSSLEMGFFSAGDLPQQLEPVFEPDPAEEVAVPPMMDRLRAAWERVGLDWRKVAVIFVPGTLIGVVLLLAGASSTPPKVPAAMMSRMAPAKAPAAKSVKVEKPTRR